VIKVTLVEGCLAYVNLKEWVVIPFIDGKGAILVGQSRLLIPGGVQLILRENIKDLADRLAADAGRAFVTEES